jgi:hypothetical protein
VILSQQGIIHSAHSYTMSNLNNSGSKDKATEQSVLSPFSGELSLDKELKLRQGNFKEKNTRFL